MLSRILVPALLLGTLLAAAPLQAQTAAGEPSGSWTDLGTVTMKGRIGQLTLKFDSMPVREVRFAYDDTSSYRISSVTILHGPDRDPWPLDFEVAEPQNTSPRSVRLPAPVPAHRIEFLYSNLLEVDGVEVRVFVR